MPARPLRAPAVDLIVASFVVLFQELALIRWLAAEVRVLAYFPNIVLMSAFLGLGLGTMHAGRRSLLWLWPAALAVLVAAALAMHNVAFTTRSVSEHLWLLYYDIPRAPVVHDVRPPIVIAFILSTVAFVPLGQIVGDRLREFGAAGKTLWGYVADLAGSLLVVIAFSAASFYGTFPAVWFGVVAAAGAWLFARRGWKQLAIYAMAAVAIVFAIAHFEQALLYSPYYALSIGRTAGQGGTVVVANGSLHQYAAPLGPNDVPAGDYDRRVRATYPRPYRAFAHPPQRVLVLGAGTGNDVATALAAGAAQIDAVEIDPGILSLGRRIHPDRPYSLPRVHVYNTDARAFLRNSRERYDLIVFGTLDSMTRLSALSNVRLDNFVYTVDCMRAARDHIAPGGGMALYFFVANQAIFEKLNAILTEAFGEQPLVRKEDCPLFNVIFLAGPVTARFRTGQAPPAPAADIPTDDWPYLYLESRTPSWFYISTAAILLALAALGMRIAAPSMFTAKAFDAEMFLFGAAFLLLETRLVTQMALLWGTTWITSAVVFASILFTILVTTIVTQLRAIPFAAAAAALIVSLVATAVVPVQWLLYDSAAARLVASVVYVGTPIVFSSICFAIRFRARPDAGTAFGWNVAGAVCGGLLELLSLTFGIRAMALLAAVLYLVAFLAARRVPAATLVESRA
jgi:hypothetical protein